MNKGRDLEFTITDEDGRSRGKRLTRALRFPAPARSALVRGAAKSPLNGNDVMPRAAAKRKR